jgi:hypothetical protein
MNAKEVNFAYKVRHALNERLDTLPAPTAERLAAARKAALSRKKKDAPVRVLAIQRALAGNVGNFVRQPMSWWGRVGLVIPVLVLVVGLIGIFQYERQQHIDETADMDVAMLTDDLPLTAYADHGFNAYLEKRAE